MVGYTNLTTGIAVGRREKQDGEAHFFVRKRETNEQKEEHNWANESRRYFLAVK